MRDTEYFQEKLYCFISPELKAKAKELVQSKEYANLHYLIDDALRKLFDEKGIELPEKPKKPALI